MVVVEEVTTLVKGTIRRGNGQVNKTGMEENVVEEESVDRTIPISCATSVTSMVSTQRIATLTNVIVVLNRGILQKIVVPIKLWKKQLTWRWKIKRMNVSLDRSK